jgi:hypothetical protein
MKIAQIGLFALAAIVAIASDSRAEAPPYKMSDEESVAKLGAKISDVPEIPVPRFAPIPPFPFKMRQAKQQGWSEYVIVVKSDGTVRKATNVGYSAKEFDNAGDTLGKWLFRAGVKEGKYRVKLRYVLEENGAANVLWK